MTATNYLYIMTMGLVVFGWGNRALAEDDVTIVAPPTTTADAAPPKKLNPDGTPIVHKSLHKKKSKASALARASTSGATNSSTAMPSSSTTVPPVSHSSAAAASWTAHATATPADPPALGPTVETGLPIARHPGPDDVTGLPPLPSGLQNTATPYRSLATTALASSSPVPAGLSSAMVGSYSSPERTTSSSNDIVFTDFSRRVKNTYPWKTGIITTMFWIGEGGSNISSTDNVASAWDENWRTSNRGTDSPYDRNGYAPASHAPTINPFYVALPFNDLAFPDKAREWLPPGWHRPRKDGKDVSACKDRWVEIKNAQGRPCYAQWEDVGPLRYDHAEYVFGPERPDTYTRAGLDVSPAVAQYLDIDGQNRAITSWRFVDDEDVPPGAWLKYDELALIYTALHSQKSSPTDSLPIQRASEPIDDSSTDDANKKKVGAAKG